MHNQCSKIMLFLLTLIASVSHAATISLVPDSASVQPGDTITLSVVADFTGEPIFGGGFDVFYDDSVLQFVSFSFDSALADDPDFRRMPDAITNELNGIGFGTIDLDGIDGIFVIGELTFVALSGGTSTLSMAMNEGGLGPLPGGLVNPGPFIFTNNQQVPPGGIEFNSATVQVVPVPAAIWMMLGAMTTLIGWRRGTR